MSVHKRSLRTLQCTTGVLVLLILLAGASLLPAQAQGNCPPAQPLFPGFGGIVSPGLPNTVRATPGMSSAVTGTLVGGEYFIVREGPHCMDGYNWWRVEASSQHGGNFSGWTADGAPNTPWLQRWTCGGMGSQHIAGMATWVTPGLPNALRSQPGSGTNIGAIPGGAQISIVAGPQCVGGRTWWQVNYAGLVGWTAEGEGGSYWLDPYYNPNPVPVPATPYTGCLLQPRLFIGNTTWITPGDPNVLRDIPGRSTSGSTVIGHLAGGTTARVLNGPVCADGYQWWYVTDGVQFGWTAEGDSIQYWVEPVVCGGTYSRLLGGQNARVTPGLPNRLRAAPDTSSRTLATIPAGATVRVLNNYACDPQGHLWWQVRYGSRTGWTAEGLNGTYWLEPS